MFLKCVFLTVLAAAVALRGWCALRVHSLFLMDYILAFEFRHMLCSLPTMKQVLGDQALFADGGVVVFTDLDADILAPVCCFCLRHRVLRPLRCYFHCHAYCCCY